jgi:hypothetical protein
MKWLKQGLIYAPSGQHGWDQQYAHLPTGRQIDGDTIRVYFASLDSEQYGRIGCVDIAAHHPAVIKTVHAKPVLDLGEPGTFDDSGVNPSCIVTRGGDTYLYYIGWQRSHRVPYALFAGVAVSDDGITFRRLRRTPVLDRTDNEPFIRSAVSIIVEGDVFRCWYVSALGWTAVAGKPYPEYVVRYAESVDGLQWISSDRPCIDLEADEFGIGRPWVVKDADKYRMWYSIRSRSQPYRIGYAESKDGLSWNRDDLASTIPRSPSGWDSEMICYPCVLDIENDRFVFYNGNSHGSTGFGYAVLERGADPHHTI